MNKIDNRILAVDPSGTGTTGIYYQNGKLAKFSQYTNKDWKEHFEFILSIVKGYEPNLLLFENSNYVSLRGKDMTYLWKLLGAIEILPTGFTDLQTMAIPVDQVKRLRSKLLKGEKIVEGISYEKGRGKGWHYHGKKISTHELDAYLVYWLWNEKEQNNKLIDKSIGEIKNKQELKQKYYE